MINTEDLVSRNTAFAARGAHEGLHILGNGTGLIEVVAPTARAGEE
ncbi:hypothetical protein ACWEO4_46190 [Streptomyces sp. NPDC004393]